MPGTPPHRPKSQSGCRAVFARGPPRHGADFPVVGIGASAGGLDALTKLVSAMPPDAGMAFVIVQHLEPTHKSLMADLLAEHTSMPVLLAADRAPLEPNHFYVISPGTYLSVKADALHVSKPKAPHGARLPIDFLLESMAKDCGDRAIAVILSGSGADGSIGAKAVKQAGGFVIAQDPGEAEFDGMPRSAIATGIVDAILAVGKIPGPLIDPARHIPRASEKAETKAVPPDFLPQIIELLRNGTAHDFTLYKMGTLQRRIERRMALAAIPSDEMGRYLDILKRDAGELDLLASDLLINVTSFFRDPKVFELLAKKVVPDIVRLHVEDRPLRIWIAGCSTGEEVYSLAMIFQEAITAAKRTIELCVFASDVDPDVVASAREGRYPATIAAEVSPERLTRFFAKDEHGYRILPDLRAMVVFTVQDVLADPPFSKLDFVSCRNLLIYLGPDAQAKVVAMFHFALRRGGILLLGSSETIGHAEGQFGTVAKPGRLYRQIGKCRPGAFPFSMSVGDNARAVPRPEHGQVSSQQPALAELCRRLVMENYAPAVVLINRRHECLYSMGPTDRYLRVAPGYPTYDVLAMATPGLRTKLRSAIEKVTRANPHLVAAGGRAKHDGRTMTFAIDIRSILHDGEELLLIGFVDTAVTPTESGGAVVGRDAPRIADLEHELEAVRTDLQAAIHDLETSGEEHRAVNEEALSVNEEYQSANEELLTSKEELQSLNEELTALNGQLQETLERQRTTSNDLQNVLYSTDVATLFLDTDLNIRFFTPATKALFNLIPGDVGRPLADLKALAADPDLIQHAHAVLRDRTPIECEIEAPGAHWFLRRILPYRTDDDGVEGVVITFTDITERKASRKALEAAKREAEQANLAKSRFLAAASHDLRQPLQSLALLQGLLGQAVEGERAHALIGRLDQTLGTMSNMLNTMLDINQIEAGVVRAEPVDFVVGDLIERACNEFADQARAQKLDLRAVPSSYVIRSDPRLIKQMLRNLISNALKYTKRGKILLGCRRHGDTLSIEVWDTGVGIPETELHAIFEEYHQIDNAVRERARGLGLGLSIVQRLGVLLGHRVTVRSQQRKGSVFAIEVILPEGGAKSDLATRPVADKSVRVESNALTGNILVVEDDQEVRELLDQLLTSAGHRATTASDANSAMALIADGTVEPDLLLSDYNLPNGVDGLALTAKVRAKLGHIPVVILTGDISTATLRDVARHKCVQLNKPVKRDALEAVIQRLLGQVLSPARSETPRGKGADKASPVIYVVDDDVAVRDAMRELLEQESRTVEDFPDCETFLAAYRPGGEACLLIDAYLPGITGIELLQQLHDTGRQLPAIMITGSSDVPMAVEAMKAGAIDFIEKPVGSRELLACIDHALELSRDATKLSAWQADAAGHIDGLTSRQHEVMNLVLAGHPSKNIAADLHISQRTVENHRASIMKKTGAKSLPALARLALAAEPIAPSGLTADQVRAASGEMEGDDR